MNTTKAIPTALTLIICAASLLAQETKPLYVKRFVVTGYPPLARQARIQGDVVATLHLDKDGKVLRVTDIEGPALLVDSANMLKNWQFAPNLHPATARIVIRFSLKGPKSVDNKSLVLSGDLPHLIEIVTNPTSEEPGPDVVPKQ